MCNPPYYDESEIRKVNLRKITREENNFMGGEIQFIK
jgi:tRNA1(Val) A37 N6-methylase TrmN6